MPPPPLIDDVLVEIFLRLPPDEPEHLFRAALVYKPWLRILCDPVILRRYRAFHGAPPLLGLLHTILVLDGDPASRITSATSMPDFQFQHPGSDGRRTRPLDSRHGRVLIHMLNADLLVWDPITGERHAVPEPRMGWMVYTAAVLCAADGCDHLDCHGGPFRLVLVATDDCDEHVKATVYSSVTGVWSAPIIHDVCEFYAKHKRDLTARRGYYLPYAQPRRVAVIEDEIYFAMSRNTAIVKYDCGKNCLCVIDPPPPDTEVYTMIALMAMGGHSLGFAAIEDSNLHLWTRQVKGAATEWAQCRVIDLDKSMPMSTPNESSGAYVAAFAEGVDLIFIMTVAGLFTFELRSGSVKKVGEPGFSYSILPYMSSYTPDHGTFLSLASREAH